MSDVWVADSRIFGPKADLTDFLDAGGQIEQIDKQKYLPKNLEDSEQYEFVEYKHELKAYTWLIDQFIYDGHHVVAGNRGVGKTTIMMHMFCVIAGLLDWPDIKSKRWRRVVIASEDVDQAHRILFGIIERYELDVERVRDRIRITHARRGTKRDVRILKAQIENLAVNNKGISLKPLVVYDTFSANFDIANEKDNSLIGAFVSTIRAEFRNWPVIIIAHVSKVDRLLKPEEQTARGAGALEGDTQGSFIVARTPTGTTFMHPTKRRDTGAIPEVGINLSRREYVAHNSWGEEQTEWIATGELFKLSADQRKALAKDAEITEANKKEEDIKAVLKKNWPDGGRRLSQRVSRRLVQNEGFKIQNAHLGELIKEVAAECEYKEQMDD